MHDCPRQVLCSFIQEKGRDRVTTSDAPRQCQAFLRDRLKSKYPQYQREVYTLIITLQYRGIVNSLLAAASTQPGSGFLKRLTNNLRRRIPLNEDAALWAVESWALALGVSINDDPSPISPRNERLTNLKATCQLDDEHICLSGGNLGNGSNWMPIEEEWQFFAQRLSTTIREAGYKRDQLRMLGKGFARRFSYGYRRYGYRRLGVSNFYSVMLTQINEITKEMHNNVEKHLHDLKGIGISIHDIVCLLDDLLSDIEKNLTETDNKIKEMKRQKDIENKEIRRNYEQWESSYLLIMRPSKRNKLFNDQVTCLQKIYTNRTWIEAWQFARHILHRSMSELDDLRDRIDSIID